MRRGRQARGAGKKRFLPVTARPHPSAAFAFLLLAALAPVAAPRPVLAAEAAPVPPFAPPESLVLDDVPPVPADLPDRAGRYTEARGALLADWHPTRPEMLVLTRFADTQQVHLVKSPGGARTQLTFYPDRVEGAVFEPSDGDYFIFTKGTGGAEFFQNYRYDLATGDVTLLTDGKSRNGHPVFSHRGGRVAYTSTRRNGKDTDLYVQFPLDPKTDRLLAEVQGGGWAIQDWSPDNQKLLVIEYVSINESYLWTFDTQTGEKVCLTPREPSVEAKVSRGKAMFARDGRGIFLTTDKDSEFMRLIHYDLATKEAVPISDKITGDVEDFDLQGNNGDPVFIVNQRGLSTLFLAGQRAGDPGGRWSVNPFRGNFPPGVITNLRCQPHGGGSKFGLSLSSARSPADIYTWDTSYRTSQRWTESELGGLRADRLAEPELIRWPGMDGREISGFRYQPDPGKYPGKRPVIINIHGGPEGQYRPGFLGRNNYLVNELGCAIIFPNVRGSSGYGKTFLTLDNGIKREDSYRDIGALLDWIKTQPGLDPDRVMLTGGSYGGHMTLACATLYADRIRCAVDIVGMSNLRTFLERTESYRRDLRRAEYGDERDPATREFMERTAPLNHADKITRPLFVIQGANDPRVPRSEAEQIVATLKRQGTPVPYLLARDEGHGFAKKKNADFQFYATVEFIRRYLLGDGDRAVPVAPAATGAGAP